MEDNQKSYAWLGIVCANFCNKDQMIKQQKTRTGACATLLLMFHNVSVDL